MDHSFSPFLWLCVALLCSISGCGNPDVREAKPNIILIYADDLGIGMLSHEGQQIIRTPNIDRLAGEGVRFTNAYSNMLCAPARASLITGLHDCHAAGFEITTGGAYKQAQDSTYTRTAARINGVLTPVPPDQVFLGQVAADAGYATAQFGKLEWGFSATDAQMRRHGWQHYLGYFDHQRAHGFYPPFLFQDGEMVHYPGNTLINCGKSGEPETEEHYRERWDMTGKTVYSQDIFMDAVLDFIEAPSDDPYFLFFPTQLPHGPVSIPQVHPDYVNDERLTQIEKEYASMVRLLDDNVGQILDKLAETDQEDNTVVIFTSDNGHELYYALEGRTRKPYTNMQTGEVFDNYREKYYSDLGGDVFNGNGGRAGMKRSNLEGGINVPFIVRWPNHITAGTTTDRLTANYDLLPTLAELTGYTKSLATDGKSFYGELAGKKEGRGDDFVVYSSFLGPALVTNDGWKIRSYLKEDAYELYYLPDDFREENNLAVQYPDKLTVLKELLVLACDGDIENGHFQNKNNIKVPKERAATSENSPG
jgi:arylsulfatase A-like enzyme